MNGQRLSALDASFLYLEQPSMHMHVGGVSVLDASDRPGGTLRFEDLDKLPRVSHIFLMQCGAPNPRGIVKWTGVRFTDFADMLGLVPGAHYARFIASDRHYVDESMDTLRQPQVMLVWLMNDTPIPPRHGAPLRLVVPFRYGNRSVKAITEIVFGTPGLPAPPSPA